MLHVLCSGFLNCSSHHSNDVSFIPCTRAQSCLSSEQGGPDTGCISLVSDCSMCCRAQQLLASFQTSPAWSEIKLGSGLSFTLLTTKADQSREMLDSLEAIRRLSPQVLAQQVDSHATRQCSWLAYRKALMVALWLPRVSDRNTFR